MEVCGRLGVERAVARVHLVGIGALPKKRIDTNDFRPLFETVDNEELAPSPKLTRLAQKLKIEHVIKHEKIKQYNDQGLNPGRARRSALQNKTTMGKAARLGPHKAALTYAPPTNQDTKGPSSLGPK